MAYEKQKFVDGVTVLSAKHLECIENCLCEQEAHCGDLNHLTTNEKSCLVSAINEVNANKGAELDTTLKVAGKAADAKAVGDALENISGGGLSSTEKNLILSLFKNAAYTTNMSATITQLETLWSGGNVPDEPEVTLVRISATYSGGSVPVGTPVSALTGIKVTAHYSDGSTGNVTGYTLSGIINEGENVVTVQYAQYATTITVIGYVVEEETPTLNGITVVYSGGNVPVGTPVHDLSGVVVTGSYSDGSTATVTEWTFIAHDGDVVTEGTNTVWVRYEDYEASFTVIGIAVDEEADVTQVGNTLIVKSGVTVTKSGSVLKIA